MASEPGLGRAERRRTQAYAAAIAVLAATALAGWRLGIPAMTRVSPEYVPIAPATAVCFLALAAAAAALARWPGRRRAVSAAGGGAVAVVALSADVLLRTVGARVGLEAALNGAFGAPYVDPAGRMSPVAAALFLLAVGAMLGQTGALARRRFAADTATALAAAVLTGGLAFAIGYFLKAPLLYGSSLIPLALPTAVGFVLLGLALLALVGHRIWAFGGRFAALLVVSLGVPISLAVYAMVEAEERAAGASTPHVIWHGRAVLLAGLAFTSLLAAYILTSARQRRATEQANRELRAAEARLRAVLETAADAIVTTDRDGRIVFWNVAAERTFGYPAEEAAQRNVADLMPERFRDDHVSNLARIAAGGEARLAGKTVEMPGLRKSGAEFPLELSVARWYAGSDVFFTAMLRDITARRQAEALEDAVLEITRAAGEAGDLGGLLRAVHGAVARLMEARNFYVAVYDAGTGEVSFPYFVDEFDPPPPTRRSGRGLTEYVLRTRAPQFVDRATFEELQRRGEVESVGADSIDWLGVPLLAGERAIGMIAVQSYAAGSHYSRRELDILTFVSREVAAAVERRRALDALARSEAQYRAVVEDQTEMICRFAADGRVRFANGAFCAYFLGGAPVSAGAVNLFSLLGDDGAARRVVEGLGGGRQVESVRLRHPTPYGHDHTLAWTFRAIPGTSGGSAEFQGVGRDITDQVALAGQVQEAQRLEAVAALAGGVAHEFNNDLQAMLATTRLLAAQRGDDAAFGVTLGKIEDAIKRGARHTRQLLVFARQDVAKLEPVDLNEVIASAAGLLANFAPASVQLKVEQAAGAIEVEGDRGRLEQVLANLAVNAVDAMPGGGVLTVRTGRDGAFARLEVVDTGVGIPEEVRRRLFEPFFTTKKGGTGLGLSVTHGIVSGLGGRVEVVSEVGKGSTFRVRLPLRPEPAPSKAQGRSPATAPGQAARLLVVDDEAGAREGLAAALAMLGYHVTPAGSGEEALAIAEREPFDLLLSDIKLPGIQGGDLARTLVARHPGLRVILMSGYTEDVAVRAEASSGRVRFLQKPFTMDAVAAEIAAALAP